MSCTAMPAWPRRPSAARSVVAPSGAGMVIRSRSRSSASPPASGRSAAAALGPITGGLAEDRERLRITIPAPDGARTLQAALDLLGHAGIAVHDIGVRRPSLDDVFLALTGHSTSNDLPAPPAAGMPARREARKALRSRT